jgi:CheY-like chemotaxis protein
VSEKISNPLTIVIIDDDYQTLRAATRQLRQLKCDVITFTCPLSFSEAINSDLTNVSLVLTDFHLNAEITGWDLVKKLRYKMSEGRIKRFPIILWSAAAVLQPDWQDANEGADELLDKLHPEELIPTVRRLLKTD